MKCPVCGKFVSKAVAYVNKWDDRIVKVEAICKKHGLVNPDDWEADDFIEEPKANDPVDNIPHN